jgi:hypothetical protein
MDLSPETVMLRSSAAEAKSSEGEARGCLGSHEVLGDGHGIDSTVTSVGRILVRRDGQSLLQRLNVEHADRAICPISKLYLQEDYGVVMNPVDH